MKTRYICLEGTEGVGKTTQTQLLVDALTARGYSVLLTKEPGSVNAPLTVLLRQIMLDKQYDDQLTRVGRELISQAARSVHLEKVIVPAMGEYDFIVQDRGILSGYAYGVACGNTFGYLRGLVEQVVDAAYHDSNPPPLLAEKIYDDVVYLRGDSLKGLATAKAAKQEYAAGDAIEAKGNDFITQVAYNMDHMSESFNTVRIDVDGKSIEEVHNEILAALGLGNK